MADHKNDFEAALSHAMLYEVGGFWNLDLPGVREGLISTPAQRKQCGYVNDPVDRGGETKYGVAKAANPDLNITTLDWNGCSDAYYKRYWKPAGCEQLGGRLAALHFDGAVNHGVKRAGIFLQRAVGTTPDGAVGPQTISKAKLLDEFTVCSDICNQREQFYRNIVKNDPSQQRFLNGWLRRISEVRQFVLNQNNFK